MTDIPIPESRVRQLRVLCLFLAEVHTAVTTGNRPVADQLLATRFDMAAQARDAAAFLDAALAGAAGGNDQAEG